MGGRPPDLKDRSAVVHAARTPRPGADVLWEEISDDLGEPRAVPREREPRPGPPPAPGSGLWGAQPPSVHSGVGGPGHLGQRRSCSCATGQTRLRRSPGAEAGLGPSCTCASLLSPPPPPPGLPHWSVLGDPVPCLGACSGASGPRPPVVLRRGFISCGASTRASHPIVNSPES